MATINPNTTVKLFSGVPLDNTYQNTLYFQSLSAQTAYFAGLTPTYTFTAQMYQRVTNGVFEAGCSIENIYDCNYMAFQNTGFENKWFYAFITSIDYVNNNNCRVHFEIDVMQTWAFDVELRQSFIERQHSATDVIGGNILPEPVAVGEYRFEEYNELSDYFNRYAVMIMIVEVSSSSSSSGAMYNGIYSGAALYAIDTETTYTFNDGGQSYTGVAQILAHWLERFVSRPEQVINMYLCPLHLLPIPTGSQTQEDGYQTVRFVPGGSPQGYLNVSRPMPSSQDHDGPPIDGYYPKNNKLYTYPYHFFHVDNGDGAELNCRYEFFKNNLPSFRVEGCIVPPVQLRITPVDYKGVETLTNISIDNERAEFITLDSFPLCSWNYDTYRAWAAQNSVPTAISAALTAGGIALAAVTGGTSLALAAGAGAIATAANAVSQHIAKANEADVCKGNTSSANSNFANRKQTFFGGRCHITRQQAVVIDDFFNMYGYAFNKLSLPNPNHRPKWYYVKTSGCNIVGNCPADDLRKMKKIYDAGVTFWHNASEVGKYWLDNSPVTNP